MKNFFNRLKQITGYEPIKSIILGNYNCQEQYNSDTEKFMGRDFDKVKVTMNYYETNAVKIFFEFQNGNKLTFDAIEMPYIRGDEVKVSLIAENKQPAYLIKDFQKLVLINPVTRIKIVLKY